MLTLRSLRRFSIVGLIGVCLIPLRLSARRSGIAAGRNALSSCSCSRQTAASLLDAAVGRAASYPCLRAVTSAG